MKKLLILLLLIWIPAAYAQLVERGSIYDDAPVPLTQQQFDDRFDAGNPDPAVDPKMFADELPSELTHPVVDVQEQLAMPTTDIDRAVDSMSKENAELYVEFDITRGNSQARVYKKGELIRSYPIHGGRNILDFNKKGQPTCAFTTVGKMLPSGMEKMHYSSEWSHGGGRGSPMPNYIEFDRARGVGAHQGPLSSYSGACIRQGWKDSEWLFNQIKDKDITEFYPGSSQIKSTKAVIEVIDNTPNIALARWTCMRECYCVPGSECFKRRKRTRACITPQTYEEDRPAPELPSDRFLFRSKAFGHHVPFNMMDYLRFKPAEDGYISEDPPNMPRLPRPRPKRPGET